MPVNSTTRRAGPFVGNGSASTFPFTFKVFTKQDLLVVKTKTSTGVETTLTLDSDYTVALNGSATPGGSVTLKAGALPSGYTLVITSAVEAIQTTDLKNQGGFYPEVITDALDRLTILIQQVQQNVGTPAQPPSAVAMTRRSPSSSPGGEAAQFTFEGLPEDSSRYQIFVNGVLTTSGFTQDGEQITFSNPLAADTELYAYY